MRPVRDVRKISLGTNYKDSMHYIVGQKVLGEEYMIESIIQNPVEQSIEIWIKGGDEIVLWKEISKDVPVVIEYNINF